MKTQLGWGVLLAAVSLAVTPLSIQGQSATYVETSKIIGTKVKTAQGDQVGEIKDVVLDSNTGCIAYTVLATGGTARRVTGTAKTVVVPWTVYSGISPEEHVYTVRVEKEKIYSAPVFEYSRIHEYSSPQWVSQVYAHYGISESGGVSGGINYRGSTTIETGRATTSGGPSPSASATASPTGTMTPSETASPSPTASPSESASPAETGSPTESASPSASPRGRHAGAHETSPATKGRTHASATPSSHRHSRETGMTPSESGQEGGKSDEAGESHSSRTQESSRGHGREETTSPEPGGTP